MTKTSRQLKVFMGNMMAIFYVFGIIMFMLIVYLLSKIIIEKNAVHFHDKDFGLSHWKSMGFTFCQLRLL